MDSISPGDGVVAAYSCLCDQEHVGEQAGQEVLAGAVHQRLQSLGGGIASADPQSGGPAVVGPLLRGQAAVRPGTRWHCGQHCGRRLPPAVDLAGPKQARIS